MATASAGLYVAGRRSQTGGVGWKGDENGSGWERVGGGGACVGFVRLPIADPRCSGKYFLLLFLIGKEGGTDTDAVQR